MSLIKIVINIVIFMNTENNVTSDSHRILLNFSNKIDWTRSNKYVALSNLRIHYIWKYIKKSYKNRKIKTSGPKWNENFQLPDRSCSVTNIQDFFV